MRVHGAGGLHANACGCRGSNLIGADTFDIDGDQVTARLKWVDTQEGLNELVIAATDVRWL
jgi:hypothetical protein